MLTWAGLRDVCMYADLGRSAMCVCMLTWTGLLLCVCMLTWTGLLDVCMLT
jgi:hypothetical protein